MNKNKVKSTIRLIVIFLFVVIACYGVVDVALSPDSTEGFKLFDYLRVLIIVILMTVLVSYMIREKK